MIETLAVNKTQARELVEDRGGFEYAEGGAFVVDQNTGTRIAVKPGAKPVDLDALFSAIDSSSVRNVHTYAAAGLTPSLTAAIANAKFRGYSPDPVPLAELTVEQATELLAEYNARLQRFTLQQTLGFSHASALTGKPVYGGTVTAKEKATRRRRSAAARVARRNNRKGA